ncbi:hypothetical protein KIPB_015446 [Kipferlia bialata]|uniref:EF-hand domain-containing protein n=1 Tax=Kipferlia bialata TaxID=797122 RepID=A0A9K3GRF8_9EUKA|nr:hypothetical protein KIPB_015446 [Kipferlia bialata]|eukprot:g15446.t1
MNPSPHKLPQHAVIEEETPELHALFNMFDKDRSGTINRTELKQMFESLSGDTLSNEEVEEMMFEADLDGEYLRHMYMYMHR